MSNRDGRNDSSRNKNSNGSLVVLHTFGLADGSAAASAEDDDGCGAASVAGVVVVASVVDGVFEDDAISLVVFIFFFFYSPLSLRVFEFDWQTVGVLSYICRYTCQSIKA